MANREGRRRRVLRDDSSAAESASNARSKKKARPYADAALVELQPRITDLIPTRLAGLMLVLLFGVASAAIVQIVYHLRVTRLQHVDYRVVSGMDLYGPGTIMSWLSSVYLLLACFAALLVYNTRRHKIDDYFGRYSLWIWVAAICGFASLDATTGLHRVVQYGLMRATGTAIWGDGSLWWIAGYGFMGLVVGGRSLLDMWPCRGAIVLGLAGGCYALAATIYLGIYRPNLGPHNVTLHSSSVLLGHFFVLYSFLLYARYIHRVAQGLVGQSRTRSAELNWWARQQERLRVARQERTAARLARKEAKATQLAMKNAAKAEKLANKQTAKAEKAAQRLTSRKKAATKKKVKANHKAASTPAKPPSDSQTVADHGNDTKSSKRRSPIDVRSVRAKNGEKDRSAAGFADASTDEMSVEELEMELLTNPNLSKNDRRKLRKRLKEQQSQQRQAA